MKWDPVGLDLGCQVGMVGDHERNLGIELAGLPAPEQVDQAVALLGDQDGHAFGSIGIAHAPVHSMLPRQGCECGVELVAGESEPFAFDLHPHEKGAVGRIAHVLVGTQNVAVVQGNEIRSCRNQAFVIRAVDQETDVIAHGQIGMRHNPPSSAALADDRLGERLPLDFDRNVVGIVEISLGVGKLAQQADIQQVLVELRAGHGLLEMRRSGLGASAVLGGRRGHGLLRLSKLLAEQARLLGRQGLDLARQVVKLRLRHGANRMIILISMLHRVA